MSKGLLQAVTEWSREDLQALAWSAFVLSAAIPTLAITILTAAGQTPRLAVITGFAVLELALGAADIVLGIRMLRELFSGRWAEGGLGTLFFMLIGAAVVLAGIALVIAGIWQLAEWRGARLIHGTLALVFGALVVLYALLVVAMIRGG